MRMVSDSDSSTISLPHIFRMFLDVVRAMIEAIRIVSAGKHDPFLCQERIKDFYDWKEITQRTEAVYESVMDTPTYDFWTRIQR